MMMKKIGVFTSGGDAPGMNACIRAVVRTAYKYHVEVMGIYNGFDGMIDDEITSLSTSNVGNIIQMGGTILKSSRSKRFRTKEGRALAFHNLKKHHIDGLVCIGGDGSYTGSLALNKEFGMPVVGCPGTIDNDIFGTDYTIGFDTAINTAMQAIDKIRDTAESHHNVFFIEVMGRHSGYIALYSGLSGGAEFIMTPEKTGEFESLIQSFKDIHKRKKQFSIIVVAEGDEDGNAMEIAKKFKKELPEYEPKVTVLGHIQRGGAPTALDRIIASTLGSSAVECLFNGQYNVALGLVNQQIMETPLQVAIETPKVPPNRLFTLIKNLSS
jgi:6-phosphofructokinase 1